MDDRKLCFETFKKSLANISNEPLRIFPVKEKQGWNDAKLQQLHEGLHFSRTAYSRVNLKILLSRFYYFYFKGSVQEGDTTIATLNDVIAISQTDLGRIWEKPPSQSVAFYKPNISQMDNLHQVHLDVIPVLAYPNKRLTMEKFKTCVSNIIDQIDPSQNPHPEEILLIRLTSFLALTLYQFATKDLQSMSNTFKRTEFRNNLIVLADWPAKKPFSPPCEQCLKHCSCTILKGSADISNVFIKIVYEFISAAHPDYKNTSVSEFLAASLLTPTANNGLGMIAMIEKVEIILNMKWPEIKDSTMFTLTCSSWSTISEYFTSLRDPRNPQRSFRWARIIDDCYFTNLTPKGHTHLATILAAVIAEVEGDGVWKAAWTKQRIISDYFKSVGRALYQQRNQH